MKIRELSLPAVLAKIETYGRAAPSIPSARAVLHRIGRDCEARYFAEITRAIPITAREFTDADDPRCRTARAWFDAAAEAYRKAAGR